MNQGAKLCEQFQIGNCSHDEIVSHSLPPPVLPFLAFRLVSFARAHLNKGNESRCKTVRTISDRKLFARRDRFTFPAAPRSAISSVPACFVRQGSLEQRK